MIIIMSISHLYWLSPSSMTINITTPYGYQTQYEYDYVKLNTIPFSNIYYYNYVL